MSNDYFIVGGVGCQTDDSFLLTQYMLNGIPPKPGFSHSVMQTTDSFLLAKHQGKPYVVKRGKTAPAPSGGGVQSPTAAKQNGDPLARGGGGGGGGGGGDKPPLDVEVNVSDEKKLITPPTEKQLEAEKGLDNEGAINEGFVKDDDEAGDEEVIINQAPKQETDVKDPKRIVKV